MEIEYWNFELLWGLKLETWDLDERSEAMYE